MIESVKLKFMKRSDKGSNDKNLWRTYVECQRNLKGNCMGIPKKVALTCPMTNYLKNVNVTNFYLTRIHLLLQCFFKCR